MKPSPIAEKLIKHYEGCKLKAYLCPAGVPTIGYGATGFDVRLGMIWTQEQADERFAHDLDVFGGKVSYALGSKPTTQGQFDALTSFAYNLGIGNLITSTLLKMHKAGNYEGAQAQFQRWNRASGQVLEGLTRRRAAEAAVYGGTSDLDHLFQQIEGGR